MINAIGDAVKAARESDNDRMQGALALKAGYDAYKLKGTIDELGKKAADKAAASASSTAGSAGSAAASAAPKDNSAPMIGVQVYANSTSSRSESASSEVAVSGTNLQGRSIAITATESDVTMAAAKLQAEDIAVSAARDVVFAAAANTREVHRQNQGGSAGFGVTFGFGQSYLRSMQFSMLFSSKEVWFWPLD